MRKFYAGKWPTLEQHVLFLGEFEPGQVYKIGVSRASQLFKLVEVINIYHGTFAFDAVHGTHVVLSDFSMNTFDVDSFRKAKDHLSSILRGKGNAYIEAAMELYREADAVSQLMKYTDE